MKGYLDAKELESYKKEDLQELAKQLGVGMEKQQQLLLSQNIYHY